MRVMLRDLSPGTAYAVQFRSNDGVNVSEWSQIQRFTTTNDLVHPANVVNLSWSDTGGSFMATWDKVVLNQDGTALNDFRWYHVQVTDGSVVVDYTVTQERFQLTREMNVAAFGTYKNGLIIKVWAVDLTHNESLTAATATASPSNPPTPSTPVVTNYLGLLLVTWNGLDSAGNAMPDNLGNVEIHVSTTSGFTPIAATQAGSLNLNTLKYVIPGLTYGTTYYVRLVAVNQSLKQSGPSVQASGIPARISGLDIANGQISAAMINFTAYDIGGANAYYPATTAARDALAGVKNGDIAYVTGSGYATYRYNGTSWVSAPEIGQISGTKILAGTVTSNAVGTNLLIAASANIGNAVIDKANIGSVDAASIVTSTMNATLTVTGRVTTALTGARVEMNAAGFQKFATDGVTKLVSITGTEALLTGTYKSAASGQRTEIGAGTSYSTIMFYSTTGTQSLLESYTTGGIDAVRLSVPITGTSQYWNSFQMQENGLALLNSDFISLTYLNTASFVIYSASNRGTPTANPTSVTRFALANGLSYYDGTGFARLNIDSAGSAEFIYPTGGTFRVSQVDGAGVQQAKFALTGDDGTNMGRYYFEWATSSIQHAEFLQSNNSSVSTELLLVHPINPGQYGAILRYVADSATGNTNVRLEVKDLTATTWIPITAGVYTNSSLRSEKANIVDMRHDALSVVRSMRIRQYQRYLPRALPKGMHRDDLTKRGGPRAFHERVETGLIADEAPAQIVTNDENGEPLGIDLYAMISVVARAVQELADKVDGKGDKK